MSAECDEDIQIIKNMAQGSVLVVGDIMLDRFVYGSVDRISPESPVPVLSVNRENAMLGGAGNTLSNIYHLGARGFVLSLVGDDAEGRDVMNHIAGWDIDHTGLIKTNDRPTIVKTRFLAGHQQLLRTDYETIKPISDESAQALLVQAQAIMPQVKAVVISDYGKGVLTPHVIQSIITMAKKAAIPVLVDPKGSDYSIYKGADVVTPNKKELALATGGMPVETDDQVIAAARVLMAQSGIQAVVATRSQDGMSVIQAEGQTHIRSAVDIEVFDVSGAGDTVIATIASALAVGASLVQAASLANIAGSVVVAKVGTAPIRAQELIAAVENYEGDAQHILSRKNQPRIERVRQAPLLEWDAAREEVLRWKARGLKVGFTNGCFDIVHFGHVTYLNDARSKCDRLIVGLNSDSSVRVLKGPLRPVHDENSRAAVLAALGSVDMVVHFGAQEMGQDNTACALLDAIQPDIYFKGGDYTIDQIPEASTVQKNGGIVDVMPVYEGHSTTKSIAKMQN